VIVAVIQARTGSTRLPGKVLRRLGDRPVLEWVIGAARASKVFDEIVVATTTEVGDDDVAELAEHCGALVVRGPVDDVLTRYLMAADATGAEVVVRLTADCPLLDPNLIAMCVRAFDADFVDYISTGQPRTVPHGLDVEVVAIGALRTAGVFADGVDRVHVTSYIYKHPDVFRIGGVTVVPACPDLRVTLDEPDDARLLDAIVAELGDQAQDWRAVEQLLRVRPDLVAINAHVRQKAIAEG
jgi:spore coat polysaccharide biosynthesis protein SpsF